jgi:D-alanyl-lipoteichoic acid acyltransferase DltB (MBOAT superfamily)
VREGLSLAEGILRTSARRSPQTALTRMLFNTWEFALFLPLVLAVYFTLNHRGQNILLLAASYVFYGWWDYRFVSLLAFSTVMDFVLGLKIDQAEKHIHRRRLLILSCVSNLTLLGVFKYFNFFTDSFVALVSGLGLSVDAPTLRIILPVGISFYTFQSMSYTIDVYRGQLRATRSLPDFALYVSFFPQLVAGPIERATRLLPQVQKKRRVTPEQISSGMVLIVTGLFRKVAIADTVAPTVARIFSQPELQSGPDLLIGLYLFSIQIYCDFAGYSDIARGTARLFGFELMENFAHPYFSLNITEFWRRWHISLSTWLRDYLYVPLGGNRGGRVATYRNLFITMLLGGLWHGANWTFVVWGTLHGVYLAIHKLALGERRPRVGEPQWNLASWPGNLARMVLTFHLVGLTWIFFRAESFSQAWTYLTGIFAMNGGVSAEPFGLLVVTATLLLPLDIAQYALRNHTPAFAFAWPVRAGAYATMVLAMFALRTDDIVPFIYFQF